MNDLRCGIVLEGYKHLSTYCDLGSRLKVSPAFSRCDDVLGVFDLKRSSCFGFKPRLGKIIQK